MKWESSMEQGINTWNHSEIELYAEALSCYLVGGGQSILFFRFLFQLSNFVPWFFINQKTFFYWK
jgi:hypothetical protein